MIATMRWPREKSAVTMMRFLDQLIKHQWHSWQLFSRHVNSMSLQSKHPCLRSDSLLMPLQRWRVQRWCAELRTGIHTIKLQHQPVFSSGIKHEGYRIHIRSTLLPASRCSAACAFEMKTRNLGIHALVWNMSHELTLLSLPSFICNHSHTVDFTQGRIRIPNFRWHFKHIYPTIWMCIYMCMYSLVTIS